MALAAALTVLSAGLAGPVLASPVCDPGEIPIRFSHVTAGMGNPKGEAAVELAERVNVEMDGKMCMEVFPNSELFNDDEELEALLLGDIQLAAPSLSKLERFTLRFHVFDLPFLFDNTEALDRFQKSEAGQEILASLEERGFHGFGFWHAGMRQLSAIRPLLWPEDADRLEFRIQPSSVTIVQFETLGATTQKLAFDEVYGALRTGAVDGQENSWANILTQRFYEVQDGITETNHSVLDYALITSSEFWNGLPEAYRVQFEQIFHEVTEKYNALSDQINEEARESLIAAGVPIRTLTPEQRDAWRRALLPVWDTFADKIGADTITAAMAANVPPVQTASGAAR